MLWSNFQKGKFTCGLLSQISPDGRYVVSTLHDCEIFTDRKDLEYSQLLFPFKGILVVYDRKGKRYCELSPDGKWLLFCQVESFMLLQKDSKLIIMPMAGGKPRVLNCNKTNN